MKIKKLLSVACAVAMMASTFVATTASASLGGKPTATATFEGYEVMDVDGENYYIATVNFEIDVTAAETLAAYVKSGNGIKGYTVEGNGVKGLAASWSMPAGFEYFDKVDSSVFTINATGLKASYLNTGSVDTYLTDYKYSYTLQYYTADADAAGTLAFTTEGTSVTGTDSTVTVATKNPTSTPWAYDYAAGTLDVVNCTIPSYNAWSTPDEPVVDDVWTSDEVSSIPEGKKIVAHSENATVTADSRVSITVDGTTKLFGETISAYLAKNDIILDGEATANVRFALLVDEAANEITFNVQ